MKCLVETTGEFMLLTPEGQTIRHEGYSVVAKSQFVSERISTDQLRMIAEVNDEATDEEWWKYVSESDGDLALALASFQSTFSATPAKQYEPSTSEEDDEGDEEQPRRRGRKPAAR